MITSQISFNCGYFPPRLSVWELLKLPVPTEKINRGVRITNRGRLLYWLPTNGSSGHEHLVEFTSVAPMTLVGLAALILALGAGYYLIKRAGPPGTDLSESP
jgi:hypothetical protein